jgi:ectoine hydroxylase-related dioxygenase (phytanoyl-CoA dioxygenase family)
MRNEYREKGFTVLRGAFKPGWQNMDALFAAWKSMPKEDYRRAARMFGAGMSQTLIFGFPSIVKAVLDLGVKDPLFLTQPAAHVMGIDEEWAGVGLHQDWTALQTGLNTVVAWIPYTQVGIENYPIEFAIGSHLKGLLPARPGAHYSECEDQGFEFEAVPCEVGDVVLFSVFTAHRTRTPGKGLRLAISHRFEDARDPWYVQHGYSAQRRVIEREVKVAPSADEVRAAIGVNANAD